MEGLIEADKFNVAPLVSGETGVHLYAEVSSNRCHKLNSPFCKPEEALQFDKLGSLVSGVCYNALALGRLLRHLPLQERICRLTTKAREFPLAGLWTFSLPALLGRKSPGEVCSRGGTEQIVLFPLRATSSR